MPTQIHNIPAIQQIADQILSLPRRKDQIRAAKALARQYPHLANDIHYSQNPHLWVTEVLGDFLWSKQIDIANSVRDYRRTAIYGCHRFGKDYVIARVVRWWLAIHPPGEALVVTSAHSGLQVKAALWREIHRVQVRGNLPGRTNQAEMFLEMPGGGEELVAFGRKPQDQDGTSFQGTYSKYVLFVRDEACFMSQPQLNAALTLTSNDTSKIVLFGNPDQSNTPFHKACMIGSGYNVIQVGYQDTPNFIGLVESKYYDDNPTAREMDLNAPDSVKQMLISPTWVDEMRDPNTGWGEKSNQFKSKCLGLFPEDNENTLYPYTWVQRAIEGSPHFENEEVKYTLPPIIGTDVGGGGDGNVIMGRFGNAFKILHRDRTKDTMVTLSNTIKFVRELAASHACIDYIGIGQGAVDRAGEISKDQNEQPEIRSIAKRIHGVKGSWGADDPLTYGNLRSMLAWMLRTMLELGLIRLPNDPRLINTLLNIKSHPSGGRTFVEDKRDMKSRGLPSPDEFDALLNTLVPLSIIKKYEDKRDQGKEQPKKVLRSVRIA